MPTITFAKQPETLELAYGKNIVSLYDTDETSPTYVVQLYASGAAASSFDVRQLPNLKGYAHFDLQNILKTRVEGNPYLETITKLTTSSYETYEYQIKAGYVLNDVPQLQVSSSFKYVFNGRKDVTAVDWNDTAYIPKLNSSSFAGVDVLSVVSVQRALTDRHIDSVLGSEITDGKPSWVASGDTVWKLNRQATDHYTLSFLNAWDNFGNGAPR
jgi:hypothetical protein